MNHDELLRHIATAEAALKTGEDKKKLVMTLLGEMSPQQQEIASVAIDTIVWVFNNQAAIKGMIGSAAPCCFCRSRQVK